MTTDNKSKARTVYDTFNQCFVTGDFVALTELFDTNMRDHNPVVGQPPGLRGFQEAMSSMRSAFPDLEFSIEDMIAEDDRVACRLTVQGRHRGRFLGIEPTGKKVVQSGIDILRFEAGKVIERWGELDQLGLIRQLGVKSVWK